MTAIVPSERGASAGVPSELERGVIKPTRMVLFARRFVPYQLYRFVWINLRMIAMIRKSHPHPRRPGA